MRPAKSNAQNHAPTSAAATKSPAPSVRLHQTNPTPSPKPFYIPADDFAELVQRCELGRTILHVIENRREPEYDAASDCWLTPLQHQQRVAEQLTDNAWALCDLPESPPALPSPTTHEKAVIIVERLSTWATEMARVDAGIRGATAGHPVESTTRADKSADTRKETEITIPRNIKAVNLARLIQHPSNRHRSQKAVALDVTNGDETKAESILRCMRRHKLLARIKQN